MDLYTEFDDDFGFSSLINNQITLGVEAGSTNKPNTSLSMENQQKENLEENKLNNAMPCRINICEEEVNPNLEEKCNQLSSATMNTDLTGPSTSSTKNIAETTVKHLLSDQPIKRKRGRPRKSETATKPKRVSTRKKKCPVVINYGIQKPKNLWSRAEKLQLLAGLEEFGCNNIEGLKQHVKTRSESEIRTQQRLWEKFAKEELEKRLVTGKPNQSRSTVNNMRNIGDWYKSFEALQKHSDPNQFALSSFFLLAAEYGKFPAKEDCNGVDFRALYRYIHCMLNSEPYYNLNTESAEVLVETNSLLSAVAGKLCKEGLFQPQMFLNPQDERPVMKTYSRAPANSKHVSSNPAAVLNLTDMNPMKLPPHVLAIPPDLMTNLRVDKALEKMTLQ